MSKKITPPLKNKPVTQVASRQNIPTPKINLPLQENTFGLADAGVDNENSIWHKITKGYVPYIIISILGLLLYANTFKHEYALDDDIIICKNRYVLQGAARLDTILYSDVFASFYLQMNTKDQLAGGRYRPLSQVTYALEQEAIGKIPRGYQRADGNFEPKTWDANNNGANDPNEDLNKDGLYNDKDVKVKGMGMRHIVNVLLYILSVCIIYKFLSSYFFKENKLLALLTALLFIAHPIHTEVVANVKSRDEILSLLFMTLTMWLSFKAIIANNWQSIILACVSYFFALLSKEYGATLLLLTPLALLLYFKNISNTRLVMLMGSLLVTFAIYYAIRSSLVLNIDSTDLQDTEILNNPFKLATEDQALATKIFINLKYLILLLVPYKLSCDYSYGTIPYQEFSNLGVIISILVLIAGAILFVLALHKRSWMAFAIAFILIHLFLINNFFFNIGATMGERLVYHSSLGVCMLLAYGAYYLFNNILKNKNVAYVFLLLPVIGLYSFKTIQRNPAWKNDYTLHLTDVQTYPNSLMLNGNACTRLIELSELPANASKTALLLDSAKKYGYKALQMHPEFVNTHINMGIIAAKQNKMDSASYYWGMVEKIYPHHPQIPIFKQNLAGNSYTKGLELVRQQKFAEGLAQFEIALKANPNEPKLLYDIGVTHYTMKNYPKAKEVWNKALSLAPNDTNLIRACAEMAKYKF